MRDRRRTERHAMRGAAQIFSRSNSIFPRECVVTEVSDGGVRLLAERVDVPDEFTLLFAANSRRRLCRVMWRKGPEIGAEFIDGVEQDFAHKMVGFNAARR